MSSDSTLPKPRPTGSSAPRTEQRCKGRRFGDRRPDGGLRGVGHSAETATHGWPSEPLLAYVCPGQGQPASDRFVVVDYDAYLPWLDELRERRPSPTAAFLLAEFRAYLGLRADVQDERQAALLARGRVRGRGHRGAASVFGGAPRAARRGGAAQGCAQRAGPLRVAAVRGLLRVRGGLPRGPAATAKPRHLVRGRWRGEPGGHLPAHRRRPARRHRPEARADVSHSRARRHEAPAARADARRAGGHFGSVRVAADHLVQWLVLRTDLPQTEAVGPACHLPEHQPAFPFRALAASTRSRRAAERG